MDSGSRPASPPLVLQSLGALHRRCSAPPSWGEHLTRRRVIGVSVATVGLVVVGLSYGESAPVLPFLLVLLGALGWAGATSRAALHRLPTPCTSCCG